MLLKNKKKENTEKPKEKKDSNLTKIPNLSRIRIYVGLIFGLSTLALILIFINLWFIAGFSALISYVILIVLTVKLFLGKTE